MASTRLSHSDYSVGWICALSEERTAATVMLDEEHETLPASPNDKNSYTLGAIGKHNVVLACLPEGETGTNSAANVVTQMVNTFPSIRFGLMVGIGGGIPPHVRLGDIVVSKPVGEYPGVVQWDFGKDTSSGFVRTGSLDRPPKALLSALTKLKTNHDIKGHKISQSLEQIAKKWPKLAGKYTWSDRLKDTLFEVDDDRAGGWQTMFAMLWQIIVALLSYLLGHGEPGWVERNKNVRAGAVGDTRVPGDPIIHYGLIASGNRVIKDSSARDELNNRMGGQVLCVEMEAAGVMNNFPCLVIRGISDYADSKKNDQWREYAAGIAAAFTKEFLQLIQPAVIGREPPVRDILNQVREEIVAAQASVDQIKSKMDKHEEKEVLDWLTSMDYGPLQSGHLKTRQTGTGQWLLELKEFQDWVTGSSQILFCHGIPGAGKTILTSLAISDLSSKFRGDTDVGMAFIYFDYKREEDQTFEKLLASVLKQLAGGRLSLPECTQELYRLHSIARTRPSLEELITDFECVTSQYSKLFIVLDALDECQSSDLVQFLSKLSDLQKDHVVNILATSRPIPQIMDWFGDINSTRLEVRSEKSDVTKYIEGQIGLLPNVVQGNLPLIEEIKAGISEATDGMFLLAKVYLTLLQDKMTVKDIREQLAVFKSQTQGKQDDQKGEILREAYGQAIERINSQKKGIRTLAMRVLTWVTFTKREITIMELQHALATEVGGSKLSYDCLPDLKDISYVCLGLVTVDEQSRIIRLAHYTTDEYLRQTQNHWSPRANETIMKCCLTYISFDVFESGFCPSDEEFEKRATLFPLFNYAANHWVDHISYNEEPSDEAMCFLESQPKVEASVQALFAVKEHAFHKNYSQEGPRGVTGLHVAARFGMIEATKSLLERGCGPDPINSKGETPLMWASYHGHETIARLLIDAGAALEAEDSEHGRTPLMWAVSDGHDAVVKLFLEKGSNVNSRDLAGRTPLTVAAISDHKVIVELLLQSGGTIDGGENFNENFTKNFIRMKLISFGVPFNDVLGSKSDVKIQRLGDSGADLDAKGSNLRSLLSTAAEHGDCGLIKLLIRTENADLNKGDPQTGMTALHWAAKKGHIDVVELLANAGADIDVKDAQLQYTPLIASIEFRHNDIVDLLLRRGADVHVVNKMGRSPLFVAAVRNSRAVQPLLDRGANVNARDHHGSTPLSAAGMFGNFDVLKLLVEKGADIHVGGYEGTAPIFAAALSGRTDAVSLLIEKGADVNAKNQDGTTPIFWATFMGNIDVVKLLAETGADINVRDERGTTPLIAAAEFEQPAIIQLLLDKGAEINARDINGESALFFAIQLGHEASVSLMAGTCGIDLMTPNSKGMTPIALAKTIGNKRIMHILLRTGRITNFDENV